MCKRFPARVAPFLISGLVAALWIAAAGPARADAPAPSPDLPWHLPEWQYRQVVSVVVPDATGKINTGLIQLAEAPPRVAEDGRDLRVLDERGRAAEFQLVNAAREKCAAAAEPGLYLIQFKIDDPALLRYLVYYGNPQAAPQFSDWDKRLGGLRLTTFTNPKKGSPRSVREMLSMLADSVKLGEGLRREINDPENPYGPSDFYLSQYTGQLYCPVDGTYSFATDSDDASFLLIDDVMAVQWPGGHSPAGALDAAHTGSVNLKAGIHRILYYHAQAGGGSLARAGWRVPGTTALVTIPETAFVRELLTESLETENRQNPISAFFTTEVTRSIQLGHDGPVFATVSFRDRTRSRFGKVAVREWDFGDGTISRESDPVHTFAGGQTFKVTLRATDRLGFESSASREVRLASEAAERLDVDMELALGREVLKALEPPAAVVRCRVSGVANLPVELVTELKRPDGSTLLKQRETATLAGGKWRSFDESLSPESASEMNTGEMVFQLQYMGIPVLSKRVRIVEASGPGLRLTGAGDKLMDEQGRLVALRLSQDKLGKNEWSLEARLQEKRTVRMAVIDDSISGASNGYPEAVAEEMDKRFLKERVEVRRFSAEAADGGYNPQRNLIDLPAEVGAFAPDVVVIAGSLRDVLRFIPVDRFERNLQALVERIRAATGAEIVLLAPPPTMGNPGLSQAYAIAAKRVGMRAQLPVADAFSAFVRAGENGHGTGQAGGWQEFYRDESGAPLYHVTPTRRGQELIAQTLTRTLCQKAIVGYDRLN